MSKAVLIMDMPESCLKCQIGENTSNQLETCIICPITEKCAIDDEAAARPNWCPLRELPEKKDYVILSDGSPLHAWGNGWNACLDAILEEVR